MRQFDVFANPSVKSRAIAPLIVVLQSHFLDELPTVVVSPLLHAAERPPFTQVALNITFNGAAYTLSIAELAAIDARQLSRTLGSVQSYEHEIRRALDRLFTGF